MGMKAIPQATVIALTIEERKALEALAGSRKSEARMLDRARIALLAASGTSSRAIARCTPGTASTWRVRYACHGMAGLSETGDRGAERPGAWAPHPGNAGSGSTRGLFQLHSTVAGPRTGRHP